MSLAATGEVLSGSSSGNMNGSHIPKRVTQHMIYLDNSEKQRPTLKVGVSLDESRYRNFYSKVADTRSEKYSMRVEGNRFTNGLSEYQNEFNEFEFAKKSGSTRKDPVGTGFQEIQPTRDLLTTLETRGSHGVNVRENNHTTRVQEKGCDGRTMSLTGLFPVTDYSGCGEQIMTKYKRANPPCERGHLDLVDEVANSTEAWQSTQRADFHDSNYRNFHHFRQREAPFGGDEPSFLQRMTLKSTFEIDYGRDPRSIMSVNDTKLPVRHNDLLLQGSTKISSHPPGYSGQLPKVLRSSALESFAKGETIRSAHDKEILRQTYSHELPNYGGQKFPLSATNDKGVRHPQWTSTTQSGLMQPYTLKL